MGNSLIVCIQDPAESVRHQIHRVIKKRKSRTYELLHYRNIVLGSFPKDLFQGTEGSVRENEFPLSHDDRIRILLLKKK